MNEIPSHCDRLSNGVWVATEALPHVRSVSLGIYLDTGSRDEAPACNGLSHFFEHMVFKGTGRLGPLDIVQRFEATGGHVNAYTSKEQTCFYGKVVDTEVEGALDALLDMVFGAKFDPDDIRKEKEVVLEEIRSTEDNPDDLIYDLFSHAAFGSQALGRPIAGTEKTVRGLSRAQLLHHRESAHQRIPVVVAAVGNVNHAAVADQVRARFRLQKRGAAVSPVRSALARRAGRFHPGHRVQHKDVQQATVLLGGPGYAWSSPRRYALLLLHSMLGDGMGSKLFQNLREKYGLVYSIFSNPEFLAREGLFSIGFATEPKNLVKAVKEIGRELAVLRRKGLSASELAFAQKSVAGGVLLGLESTHTRMATLARRLLGRAPGETIDRVLARLAAVTRDDVLHCAREILRPEAWASAAVVPKGVSPELPKLLAQA